MDRFESQHGEGRLGETENTLRISEERLGLALHACGMGVFDWDVVRDKLVWTRRHEELWGYAPGEFSGTLADFTSRVHPEDWPGVEQAMKSGGGGKPFAREFRVVWPDGTVRWVSSHGVYECDAMGRALRVCGVVSDVTDGKRAKEGMARNDQRARLALGAAKAGTWEWNVETGEVFWSEELWNLFGLAPHSGRPTIERWRATVHPEDLPAVEQKLTQAPSGKAELEAEWRVQDTDGQIRWLMSRGRLLRPEAGGGGTYIGIVVDITERKRDEEGARRWQQVFEGAQFGMAREDLKENRFLEVNTVFATERGYRLEELAGRSLLDVYAPEGREAMRERLATIDERGRLVYEATHLRKDGSRFPVLMEVTVIKDDAGRPLCRVAHAVDITAWKRAEAELRRSEERFNQALHLLREGVIIATDAGKMLYWNPAALRMHGMKAPQEGLTSLEELGKIFDLWTLDGGQRLPPREWPIARLLGGGGLRNVELRLRRPDHGWERIVSYSGMLVQTADAERLVILMVLDLTDQRRAEAGLRESEGRYRSLFQSSQDAVILGTPDGRVLATNPAACQMLGYSEAELREVGRAGLFDPCDPDLAAALRTRAARGQVKAELLVRRRGGTQFPAEFSSNVFTSADGSQKTSVIIRDITERKRAETLKSLSIEVLDTLNQPLSLSETVGRILAAVRRGIKVDVAAIRLREGECFPYFGSDGLPLEQLRAGDRLSTGEVSSHLKEHPAAAHNPGCPCAQVLAGMAESENPCFTPSGSFWTSDSQQLPGFGRSRLCSGGRSTCRSEDFRSVALVSIRTEGQVVGLLQLNGQEAGKFTGEIIQFCEGIASSFGVALKRRRAEEALRESEQRFRDLVFTVADWVWEVDSSGRFTYASENVLQLLGYHRSEILGRTPYDLMSAEEAERFKKLARQFGAEKRPFFDIEHISLHRDGTPRHLITSGVPILAGDGTLLGYRGADKDITERKRSEHQLQLYSEQLRALTAHLESLREAERTRIAREIHDELGQILTGVRMDLDWMERELGRFPGHPGSSTLLEKLLSASELVDTVAAAVQRIAAELRPGILDKLGLFMALRHEADQFQERSGIVCRLELPEAELRLSPAMATGIYRIAQEALTNVARHSGASYVEVLFQVQPDILLLEVRDDGKGLPGDAALSADSLGLLGIRERARQMGGEASFRSEPGSGTVVGLRIPQPAIEPNIS